MSSNAAKKRRRADRMRASTIKKKPGRRWKWTIASSGFCIAKICWPCMGTGLTFVQVQKPRFKPCIDCGGVGGELRAA